MSCPFLEVHPASGCRRGDLEDAAWTQTPRSPPPGRTRDGANIPGGQRHWPPRPAQHDSPEHPGRPEPAHPRTNAEKRVPVSAVRGCIQAAWPAVMWAGRSDWNSPHGGPVSRRGKAAVGSPGVLGGDLFRVPVHVPVDVCGVWARPGRRSPVRVRAMPTCAVRGCARRNRWAPTWASCDENVRRGTRWCGAVRVSPSTTGRAGTAGAARRRIPPGGPTARPFRG